MTHPQHARWLNVHVRFAQGDRVAWEEIAAYYLPLLSQSLLYRRPDVDVDMIDQTVEDALLGYLNAPQRFDATRGVSLGYWLLIQARGGLSNALRKEGNRQKHERAAGIEGQFFEKNARTVSRKWGLDDYLLTEEEAQSRCPKEAIWLMAKFSQRELVELELLTERAPLEEWVNLLSLQGLPEAERRPRIQREKERLRKKRLRVRKMAERIGYYFGTKVPI